MLPPVPAPPFVKVCGFIDASNLCRVCDARTRPDAVGLNLWEGSKRFVPDVTAAGLATLPGASGVTTWGVFVDPTVTELRRTGAYRLAAVQLHGDEPPNAFSPVARLRSVVSFVLAWRAGKSLDPLLAHLAAAPESLRPDAVLLDAAVPGAYGGTGTKLDWHALRAELDRVGDRLPPVILAGGLTPGNVAEAVKIVRPWGVDVAGGVESAPGIKDPAKVAAFVAAAKDAAVGPG